MALRRGSDDWGWDWFDDGLSLATLCGDVDGGARTLCGRVGRHGGGEGRRREGRRREGSCGGEDGLLLYVDGEFGGVRGGGTTDKTGVCDGRDGEVAVGGEEGKRVVGV